MSVDISKMKPIVLSIDEVTRLLAKGKVTICRPVRMNEPPRNIEGETYTPELLDDWTWCWKVDQYHNTYDGHAVPPCFMGDILCVKETWQINHENSMVLYKAGGEKPLLNCEESEKHHSGWNSPVSMPKKYARLFVKVNTVHMERARNENASEPWVWFINLKTITEE